jgi:23S rRNA pseudouridine1911/1915/1917 synthase
MSGSGTLDPSSEGQSIAEPMDLFLDESGQPRMVERRFVVESSLAGHRLDHYLKRKIPRLSRTRLQEIIRTQLIGPDGRRLKASSAVREGDELVIRRPARAEPSCPRELPVLHRDEHLLVVDKPAGVVVHPARGHRAGTLAQALKGRIAGGDDPRRAGIVHRLDRDTSGLLVVARSEEAHERLKRLVQRRELEREYLTLVRGRPRSRAGRIEAPIGRDRRDPTRHSLETDRPRDAVTHFELVEQIDQHALLRVRLETGRTHQIRVHLAAIGLPVVGDPVYGAPDPALGRQFLHAARLAFTHPFTGERVVAESPLPVDLARYLEDLR